MFSVCRRKCYLFEFQEQVRLSIVKQYFKSLNIVGNMLLEACKLSRASRSKMCREELEYSYNKGYYFSKFMKYYAY